MIAWLLPAPSLADDDDPPKEALLPAIADALPVIALDVAGVPMGDEYAPQVYVGAAALGLDPAYVDAVRTGLHKLYLRDYRGVRAHFQELETAHPGAALDAVADVLVYQAMMFENYDFRFEKPWEGASKRARAGLEAAFDTPGGDAWEHFLYGGVVGIESIHGVRREQWLGSLQLAFEAMDHASLARAAAPKFHDLLLADGMYNYWRTVITESSKVLPRFGDHRAEGIAQMQAVEQGGVFLQGPATLSLALSWIEEDQHERAIASCEKNRAAYPDNVINNLLTGRTYVNLRKYDAALDVFRHVIAVAPENRFVHYYKGVAEMKSGRLADAEASLATFLAFDGLETWQRSNALYRLGQVHYKQKRYDDAEEQWQSAVKLDGNGPAKTRLERLRDARKEGTLPG